MFGAAGGGYGPAPPGFVPAGFPPGGFQTGAGVGPYPAGFGGQPSLAELFNEVRAGKQNVENKFAALQNQISGFQAELSHIKGEMVTESQFEGLQGRVTKIEAGSDNAQLQALRVQLNRLDPATKTLAIHGIEDTNLARRTKSLEEMFAGIPECPVIMAIDHIHKGKRDERIPTKVSLIEFRSNGDREKALKKLEDRDLKDSTGSKLTAKRARTNLQKQRNDLLIKAESLIKVKHRQLDEVKINWRESQVVVKNVPAFCQDKEGSSGSFLPPFTDLVF